MEQYFNQFITPDIKPGDKLPVPEYTDNMYTPSGRRFWSDEVYISKHDKSDRRLTLTWDSTEGRTLKDLPTFVNLNKNGIVISIEYTFDGFLHRTNGPALLLKNGEPMWFLLGDKFFGKKQNNKTTVPNEFLKELCRYLKSDKSKLFKAFDHHNKHNYINLDHAIPYLISQMEYSWSKYIITDELIDYLKRLSQ